MRKFEIVMETPDKNIVSHIEWHSKKYKAMHKALQKHPKNFIIGVFEE